MKSLLAIVLGLGLLATSQLHASGTYSANIPQQVNQYSNGKAVFYQRDTSTNFIGCHQCHQGSNKLSRPQLQQLPATIPTYQNHCNSYPEQCRSEDLTLEKWQALMIYLTTRYRLQ